MTKPDRQLKREADRAFKRFDDRGCCRCGKQPTPGVLEALVRGTGRRLRAIHTHCVRTEDTVLAAGAFVAKVSPHLADDRQWFEANPSRLARLRRPFDAGETNLLVNHAHLAELKQSGQSTYSDRLRE
jgi:hypothetical protein